MGLREIVAGAVSDISAGLRLRRVWLALAQEDIGDQHRRTTLGPVWMLLNYLAFAGTFIFIFHRGDSDSPNYPAYVATGLFVWFYLMETITHSVTLFAREESFIKGTTLPLSVYVMRLQTQSVIRAAYALAGCLAIILWSGVPLTPLWGWSALGLAVIFATAPAVIIVFGFLGAFFPDSQFVVANLMRVGMFVTPVFWSYTGGGGIRGAAHGWNPFTYFLEIVRAPIVTGTVPWSALAFCTALGVLAWILALLALGSQRRQIAFVL